MGNETFYGDGLTVNRVSSSENLNNLDKHLGREPCEIRLPWKYQGKGVGIKEVNNDRCGHSL